MLDVFASEPAQAHPRAGIGRDYGHPQPRSHAGCMVEGDEDRVLDLRPGAAAICLGPDPADWPEQDAALVNEVSAEITQGPSCLGSCFAPLVRDRGSTARIETRSYRWDQARHRR